MLTRDRRILPERIEREGDDDDDDAYIHVAHVDSTHHTHTHTKQKMGDTDDDERQERTAMVCRHWGENLAGVVDRCPPNGRRDQ